MSNPLDCSLNNQFNILHIYRFGRRSARNQKGLLNPWHTFAMRELSHLLSFNDRRRHVINTNPPQPYSLSAVLQGAQFLFLSGLQQHKGGCCGCFRLFYGDNVVRLTSEILLLCKSNNKRAVELLCKRSCLFWWT